MSDFHITNGDSAADIIQACGVGGDVLPWRDVMHHGPFPTGLDLDKLSEVRATYFAGEGDDESEIRREFRARNDHLRSAPTYDRVVLWFEHDLLDQLQILQLLDWFSETDLGQTSLELICIDRFDGIDPFRGIGQLNTEQMASLFSRRQTVTAAEMDLAKEGWAAFRSSDPQDLEAFLKGDLTPLPFLHPALCRHLEEYPSHQTGLTRTENQILTLISDGTAAPGKIFSDNMDLETVLFIGDWTTFRYIGDLSTGDDPLLACEPDGVFQYPPCSTVTMETFRSQRLRLTKVGEQVLTGSRDAFDLLKRDQWLGGVHLRSNQPIWTWDDNARTLRRYQP